MGVRHLQGAMDKGHCPGGSETVEIEKLVKEYRAKYRGVCPVVVVDACGCMHKLYGGLCWVMGGQLKEFISILEDFIERFRKIGIKLIFFFDGLTIPDKRQKWVKGRLEKIKRVKEIFAKIREGEIPSDDYTQLPYGLTTVVRMALKYVYKCEVFNSRKECDREIAGYAKSKNCFAILAQDSDFIIFDTGTVPYLSLTHLDLSTMTTIRYDGQALAGWLRLRINQLPLFASLCGNDTISYDSLRNFRRYLYNDPKYGRNSEGYQERVANFVRHHWQLGSDPNLSTIAEIALGDVREEALLKKAILAYDTNYDELMPRSLFDDIKELATWRHVICENTPFVFNILCLATFDSSNALEESKLFSSLPFACLLYRPVRQRCYYVMQTARDPSDTTEVVEEWCAYDGNSLDVPERVKPMPCSLPSGGETLQQLWLNPCGSSSVHLEAFLTCFGVAFDHNTNSVPQNYFVFCCIVNFLVRNTRIEDWQVDVLIAQAIILNSTDIEFLQRLRIFRYNPVAVHLATLFMYGVCTVFAVLGVCSSRLDAKLAMPWNFFDGKLFHHCYVRAMEKYTNYTDNDAKTIDRKLFDAVKRMCLSKKPLV